MYHSFQTAYDILIECNDLWGIFVEKQNDFCQGCTRFPLNDLTFVCNVVGLENLREVRGIMCLLWSIIHPFFKNVFCGLLFADKVSFLMLFDRQYILACIYLNHILFKLRILKSCYS